MALVALIEVSAGPGAGQKVRLEVGHAIVIGRGADAHLALPDPKVSRRHVELDHRAEGLLVRDLGSKRGATLDGRAIPKDGVLVALRATLLVGDSRLKLLRVGAAKGPELPGLRLEEKLGEGGAGEVFAAWQDPPGRRVAVKALAQNADEVTRKRLEREAALEGRLDHPSILRVFGLVLGKGRLYLVRELVDGGSLDEEIARGALAPKRAAEVGATIAVALAHAHSRGVVHRDVKPGNILVERATSAVKLADFDLARDASGRATLAEATRLTQSGEGLGTLSYVAPEQLEDAHHAGAPADVYGLAAVLYHALAGEPPFFRTLPEDYVTKLLGDGPPPLAGLAPGVPAKLAAVVTRALSVAPGKRPAAEALARELTDLARAL